MLTKELLRFRRNRGYIKPVFVKTDNPELLQLADRLISFYVPDKDIYRGEVEEAVASFVGTCKDPKLVKGLNKLLLDRCEFSVPASHDYQNIRKKIFAVSADLLKNSCSLSEDDFRRQIFDFGDFKNDLPEIGIYSDLPENEKLISIKKIFPRELLERYNCSLVQSLLIYTSFIEIFIEEPEPAKMRKIFRYLKFFCLLAEVCYENTNIDKTEQEVLPTKVKLKIDGPLSLFESTRKYGLRLAAFFPVICTLSKWRLEARIKVGEMTYGLKLDEKSNLKSYYRNSSAYVPEEFLMFYDLFNEKIKDWEIIKHSPVIDFGSQDLVFPDFSFSTPAKNGKVVHLELFHRWHHSQLLLRLESCGNNVDLPLIIGVDRALYRKPEIKSRLDSCSWFEVNGFLFSDFPGVDRVHKCLRNSLNYEETVTE